jgi:hypothetical protein
MAQIDQSKNNEMSAKKKKLFICRWSFDKRVSLMPHDRMNRFYYKTTSFDFYAPLDRTGIHTTFPS